jgi:hypothetical protein
MSAWKTVVGGVFFWAAATVVSADTISWPTSTPFNWTNWSPGQNSGLSGNLALPASSNPQAISNAAQPPSWSPPAFIPAAPSVASTPAASSIVTTPAAQTFVPMATPVATAPAPSVASAPLVASPAPFSAAAAASPVLAAPIQPPTSSTAVDAFVNLGTGPYPNAGLITTGNAQAWYQSPKITSLFGGQPTPQQVSNFDNTVIQRIEHTFQQSGVPIALTTDPNVPTAHTLSLVSNTVSNALPTAIGMTQLGGSGFSFIDQIAPSAQSVDQLEWIIAHNISHELMLAFGVGENYDKSGRFIDARDANFAMMVDPNASFSQGAAQALLSTDLSASNASVGGGFTQAAQVFGAKPVPEPATMIVWAAGLSAGVLYRRKRMAAK